MAVQPMRSDAPQVRAPNGVVWTRKPDGRSSAADLLRELADLGKNHIEREWDWWEDGRRDREHDRQWAVLAEWDNGAKDPPGFGPEAASKAYMEDFDRRMDEERGAREALAAERYDKERESLQMLAAEADAAFFGHVLGKPATSAQRDKAEQRMEQSRTTAAAMREQFGAPDDVVDRNGYLPAQRRTMNLSSHLSGWRHPPLVLSAIESVTWLAQLQFDLVDRCEYTGSAFRLIGRRLRGSHPEWEPFECLVPQPVAPSQVYVNNLASTRTIRSRRPATAAILVYPAIEPKTLEGTSGAPVEPGKVALIFRILTPLCSVPADGKLIKWVTIDSGNPRAVAVEARPHPS